MVIKGFFGLALFRISSTVHCIFNQTTTATTLRSTAPTVFIYRILQALFIPTTTTHAHICRPKSLFYY